MRCWCAASWCHGWFTSTVTWNSPGVCAALRRTVALIFISSADPPSARAFPRTFCPRGAHCISRHPLLCYSTVTFFRRFAFQNMQCAYNINLSHPSLSSEGNSVTLHSDSTRTYSKHDSLTTFLSTFDSIFGIRRGVPIAAPRSPRPPGELDFVWKDCHPARAFALRCDIASFFLLSPEGKR